METFELMDEPIKDIPIGSDLNDEQEDPPANKQSKIPVKVGYGSLDINDKAYKAPASHFENNISYLNDETSKYLRYSKNFTKDVFKKLGLPAMLNGKEVDLNSDISIGDIEMLYNRAKEAAFNDPEILSDAEQMIKLGYKTKIIDDKLGIIRQGQNVINKDMLLAVKNFQTKHDTKNHKQTTPWISLLVNEDGSLKPKDVAIKDIEALKRKERKRQIEEFERKYPKPRYNSVFQPSDQTAVYINTHKGKQAAGVPITSDFLGWQQMYDKTVQIAANSYQDINYDMLYDNLIKTYNEVGNSVPALQKDMLNLTKGNNKGGLVSTIPGVVADFDVNKLVEDEETGKVDEKLVYAKDFLNTVWQIDEAKYTVGDKLAPGNRATSFNEIESIDAIKTLLVDINDDLYAQIKKSKKSPNTNLNRIRGSLKIEPIVADDDNYHAVHIKFRPEYLNKYIGSENKPGILYDYKDQIKDGFTVYFPADKAAEAKMKISIDAKRGSTVSPVEGLITLSKDNSVTRYMPMGGMYKISLDRNPDSPSYTIEGYNVAYRPSTGKFDTIPINQYKLKDNLDLTLDIDKIDKNEFESLLSIMKENIERKNEHYRIMGKK